MELLSTLYLSDGISFIEENFSEIISIIWENVYFMVLSEETIKNWMFRISIIKNKKYKK